MNALTRSHTSTYCSRQDIAADTSHSREELRSGGRSRVLRAGLTILAAALIGIPWLTPGPSNAAPRAEQAMTARRASPVETPLNSPAVRPGAAGAKKPAIGAMGKAKNPKPNATALVTASQVLGAVAAKIGPALVWSCNNGSYCTNSACYLPNSPISHSFCPVTLNEFSADNESLIEDPDATQPPEFDDWIELHNRTNSPVSLDGWKIGDNSNWFAAHALPSGTSALTIPANSHLLLWADKEPSQGGTHLDFKLSKNGEDIYLWNGNKLMDSMDQYGPMDADTTLGRWVNGTGSWYTYGDTGMPTASPGSSNPWGCDSVIDPPLFSQPGGLQYAPVSLAIYPPTSLMPSAEIRYTVDGSLPGPTSSLYAGPIAINTSTSVRARMFTQQSGWCPSAATTATYVLNQSLELPVVAISGSPSEFNDLGVYGFSQGLQETPIHVEYYEPAASGGALGFELDSGLKLHGDDRPAGRQQNLRIVARQEYGTKWIEHDIFDERPSGQRHKRLILRNGSTDCVGTNCGNVSGVSRGTLMRDQIIHRLYSESDFSPDFSASRSANVFINGQYWGIYNIREKQDHWWVEELYGHGEDEINILEYDHNSMLTACESTISGDWNDLHELKAYVRGDAPFNNPAPDLADPTDFAWVRAQVDLENFVDYQIYELFAGNKDWRANNVKFWKPRPTVSNPMGGKWKWILWDTEFGMARFDSLSLDNGPNWIKWAVVENTIWGGCQGDFTYLFRESLANNRFREYFITRFADLLNTRLSASVVGDMVDDFENLLEDDMVEHRNRWVTSPGTYAVWADQVEILREFATNHQSQLRDVAPYADGKGIPNVCDPSYPCVNQGNPDWLNAGSAYDLTLGVSPAQAGRVDINTIEPSWLTGYPWTGVYFRNVPVTLTATAAPLYVFKHWRVDGVPQNWPQTVNVTLPLSTTASATSVTAVFSQSAEPCCPPEPL